EAECQTLQDRIQTSEAHSLARQTALAISEANLADARYHIRRFNEVLKAIESSRSWRWTRPLRLIKDGVARTKPGEERVSPPPQSALLARRKMPVVTEQQSGPDDQPQRREC